MCSPKYIKAIKQLVLFYYVFLNKLHKKYLWSGTFFICKILCHIYVFSFSTMFNLIFFFHSRLMNWKKRLVQNNSFQTATFMPSIVWLWLQDNVMNRDYFLHYFKGYKSRMVFIKANVAYPPSFSYYLLRKSWLFKSQIIVLYYDPHEVRITPLQNKHVFRIVDRNVCGDI